jgi:hypothetical protein
MTFLNRTLTRLSTIGIVAAMMARSACAAESQDAAGIEFFEKKIRPVLVEHCYECHSRDSKSIKSGLLLDSRDGIRKGGESGPAIVSGKPQSSPLIAALQYESAKMPPAGKLPASVIADFAKWVAMGVPDPRRANSKAMKLGNGTPDGQLQNLLDHWAFQKPERVTVPVVRNRDWPQNEIDNFVLKKLEDHEITPVGVADRRTLVRRLYFDLTGLPPAPSELEDSGDAVSTIVDRLLDSQHFGERWGRHWMDVVRYADSVGGGGNFVFDNAWRYRDWIIRSLNSDMPYDRFVAQQIAGDLLPADSPKQRSQQIIATGFLAIGRKELPEYDKEKLKMDVVDEQIDTLGKAFLGISLGCARCHDHKFEPVQSQDYYALAGFFESSSILGPRKGPHSTWVLVDLPGKSGKALAVRDVAEPCNSSIRIRGDAHAVGDTVNRGFVRAFDLRSDTNDQWTGSGRLELAHWVASEDNPLTARVMVNRIWHWLHHQGIVATPDNFGTRGQPPTHSELIDWLTMRFVEEGWSIKKTIRRIVLSRTYQLSTQDDSVGATKDPDNQLNWRHRRHRLESESIRDAMLQVAGQLDPKQFGKTLTFTGRLDEGSEEPLESAPWKRRSVYLPRYREYKQLGVMQVFDSAHSALVTGRRSQTTVPTQALYLMNSPFVMECATGVANRVLEADSREQRGRIELAYQIMLGRDPTASEFERDLGFLKEYPALVERDSEVPDAKALAALCHTILASSEFLYVE